MILLLNKIDLVLKENVLVWLMYFCEELLMVVFKCATFGGSGKLGARNVNFKLFGNVFGGVDFLGVESVLEMLKNYVCNKNIKMVIMVGIVGFLNVGKSSFINSLKRSRIAAAVGNMLGMIKVLKEIKFDKYVKLIDFFGVVFVSVFGEFVGVVVLCNCIKVERIDDLIVSVYEIIC